MQKKAFKCSYKIYIKYINGIYNGIYKWGVFTSYVEQQSVPENDFKVLF